MAAARRAPTAVAFSHTKTLHDVAKAARLDVEAEPKHWLDGRLIVGADQGGINPTSDRTCALTRERAPQPLNRHHTKQAMAIRSTESQKPCSGPGVTTSLSA